MSESVESTSSSVLDFILRKAIEFKASDVHLEPERGVFHVRLRIDGLLYPVQGLDSFPETEIISRIKVLAEMDLFEHRLPQDGHFEFTVEGKVYNIRVSTSPTVYGQAVVLRIFNREGLVLALSNMGFEPEQLEQVRTMIASPYGMALITGQIGSGKTTLLYSLLNELNTPQRNIITLEDPVEFQVANLRQLQVNEANGFTFAKAIKAAVRQDPDVIMLGEIRDSETAQIAFQAALTGSLVFSTFHTFDVSGLIIRLIEMGVPRSVVAHALTGVMSTRLVRKICTACVEPYEPTAEELAALGTGYKAQPLFHGKGCVECHERGYSGRIGVFEVVRFDDDIRTAIIETLPTVELRKVLSARITRTLREAAVAKVLQGVTSASEIIRVIGPHT